jgi:hypothetical protein
MKIEEQGMNEIIAESSMRTFGVLPEIRTRVSCVLK